MSLSHEPKFLAAILCLVFFQACHTADQGSATKDIFTADNGDEVEGNARRHPASDREKLYTIKMNGCTAQLIGENYLLTAAHCRPSSGQVYTSGSALAAGKSGDITVVKLVEYQAPPLDYAILAIKWNEQTRPAKQFMVKKIATAMEMTHASEQADHGDEVFTVGFPVDKIEAWGATYSEGRLKRGNAETVWYNMGTINGNSGGAVLTKKDETLVSLTNNGTHFVNAPGWNNNDLNDAKAWNFGIAAWRLYATSRYFQEVFPKGIYDAAKERAFVPVDVDFGDALLPKADFHKVLMFEDPKHPELISDDADQSVVSELPDTFEAPLEPCEVNGVEGFMHLENKKLTTFTLSTHFTKRHCKDDANEFSSKRYQVNQSTTDECGIVSYEGQLESSFDRATKGTFRLEDHTLAKCDSTPVAPFILTETLSDGTVHKWYGRKTTKRLSP